MMLTAIPANPSSSLFAHNHTLPIAVTPSPSSQPGSPDTDPQAQGSAHILRGSMDGKAAASGGAPGHMPVNQPPQVIPMSAMHQPFFLGAGPGGYTLVPSIQQLGNLPSTDGHLVGIQPLSAISTLPRPGVTMQPLAAIPSGYYGRVQTEPIPMSFQQQPIQQLAGFSPPSSSSGPLPPHHLLISGTGSGVVVNGGRNMEVKPRLPPMERALEPSVKMSVLSPPSSSSSPSSSPQVPHQKNSLDKVSSTSDPDICHRANVDRGLNGAESQSRRRSSHDAHLSYSRSRAARHVARSSTSSPPPSSSSSSDVRLPQEVLVKREPTSAADDSTLHRHHTHTTATQARRNSDSNLEETAASSSSKSYQISALIDIPPMAPPLNRASRTSSLSSSLSSFRFGGSLSQLWASQISLSGKINNMKSTG